ncbi:MAG: MarR family transcriptional regulator [Clostridiales bacterium]|nr:MarR family transcriptional regulator [Clostridiales bacterium]
MPSFMRKISIISRCAMMYRAEKLKDTGLGGVHLSYILALCRHPGMSQEQIARHIYINKSNVTRHLAQLEQKGFVERRQNEKDRREQLVYPTQKAYDVLPELTALIRDWNEYLTEGFSDEEMEQFNAMLDRIARRATDAVNKEFEENSPLDH